MSCTTFTFWDFACIKYNNSNIDENINSNAHLNNRILLNGISLKLFLRVFQIPHIFDVISKTNILSLLASMLKKINIFEYGSHKSSLLLVYSYD